MNTAAQVAMADQAAAYRDEARRLRDEAMARYPTSREEARALELSASQLIAKAADIEREIRGLPPRPKPGPPPA